MPLIPFPNVPSLPGVPNLPRLPGGGSVLGIAGAVGAVLLLRNRQADISPSKWLITDKNGKAVIEPDSVVGLLHRSESRVASYPVEDGSFASYNKVETPYDLRLIMTCSGTGKMNRSAFLEKLEALKKSLDLCSVVTPERVYKSLNLVQYDIQRMARGGATLLTVEAGFMEIRVTASSQYSKTASPGDAAKVSNGTVQALKPTPQQIEQLAPRRVS